MTTSAHRYRFGTVVILMATGLARMPIAPADEKEAAPPKQIRVLFVGNSQFYFKNMHKIVEASSADGYAKTVPEREND